MKKKLPKRISRSKGDINNSEHISLIPQTTLNVRMTHRNCLRRKEYSIYYFQKNEAFSFIMLLSIKGERGRPKKAEGCGSQTQVTLWNITTMMEHVISLREFACFLIEKNLTYVGSAPKKSYELMG